MEGKLKILSESKLTTILLVSPVKVTFDMEATVKLAVVKHTLKRRFRQSY